jgi:hypothetical protein
MKVFIIFSLLHVCSFVMEWVYQRMCYPTHFWGFFTSMFTHSSLMCTNLREFSAIFDNLFLKGVIAIIAQVIKDKSCSLK